MLGFNDGPTQVLRLGCDMVCLSGFVHKTGKDKNIPHARGFTQPGQITITITHLIHKPGACSGCHSALHLCLRRPCSELNTSSVTSKQPKVPRPGQPAASPRRGTKMTKSHGSMNSNDWIFQLCTKLCRLFWLLLMDEKADTCGTVGRSRNIQVFHLISYIVPTNLARQLHHNG